MKLEENYFELIFIEFAPSKIKYFHEWNAKARYSIG